jgi:hypothetical protein
MRTLRYTIVTFFATAVLAYGELNFTYDSNTHRWDLSNGVIHAVFALDSDGTFQFKGLDSRVTGKSWLPAEGRPSSPIRVRFGSTTYDANTHFKLLKQYVEKPSPDSVSPGDRVAGCDQVGQHSRGILSLRGRAGAAASSVRNQSVVTNRLRSGCRYDARTVSPRTTRARCVSGA